MTFEEMLTQDQGAFEELWACDGSRFQARRSNSVATMNMRAMRMIEVRGKRFMVRDPFLCMKANTGLAANGYDEEIGGYAPPY